MSPMSKKTFPEGNSWMKVLRAIGEMDERIRRTNRKENITVTTIMKGTDIMTPYTVARAVKYLQHENFVYTRPKGREVLIHLTQKGNTMADLLREMEMWGERKWY